MKKSTALLWRLIPFILSVIGCIYVLVAKEPLLVVSSDDSFHFNLITINALFGGFLYTNYSLLIGLSDNKLVEKLKDTNILEKRNFHIYNGIFFATVSVVSGIILVLYPKRNSLFSKVFYSLMQNTEIVFMAFLIIYFLLSLREMSILVERINISEKKLSTNEINKLKDKIISRHNKP